MFAELRKKQFSSKSSCDVIKHLPTLLRKIFWVHARAKQVHNFICATHFFGEISRIGKTSALNSHMLIRKCNCEELMKLNCYEQNFLLLICERIYSIRILITLFIDWRTYCLSFARLNY